MQPARHQRVFHQRTADEKPMRQVSVCHVRARAMRARSGAPVAEMIEVWGAFLILWVPFSGMMVSTAVCARIIDNDLPVFIGLLIIWALVSFCMYEAMVEGADHD